MPVESMYRLIVTVMWESVVLDFLRAHHIVSYAEGSCSSNAASASMTTCFPDVSGQPRCVVCVVPSNAAGDALIGSAGMLVHVVQICSTTELRPS
jgi:hypothetical protein